MKVYILYLEFLHENNNNKISGNRRFFSVPVRAGALCTLNKREKVACSSLISQILFDIVDIESNQYSLLKSLEISRL